MTGIVAYILSKKGAKIYTDEKFASISGGFNYKGSVDSVDDLPVSSDKGDEYTLRNGAGSYVFDGEGWQVIGAPGPEGPIGPEGPAGRDGTHIVSVSETGEATDNVKYITIDGEEHRIAGGEAEPPTEYSLKLEEDLYTYVNIGKITGASQTNPIKVAKEGDSLKEVFNMILGTEIDVDPTINQSGTTFTKSNQSTSSFNGAEVGTNIVATTGTVTFKVTNTATCTYGLKAGTYDTYNKQSPTTFTYPIKNRIVNIDTTPYTYQIRIKYPALNGCTISVSEGTLVKDDDTNGYLYCNLSSNNNVKISINLPAKLSTTSSITRFGQLNADIAFGEAEYNNIAVDNFWTYLKQEYNNGKIHSDITGVTSTAFTITAGAYYPYYMQSDESTQIAPISNAIKSTDAACYTNGADYAITKKYFYFLVPNSISHNTIQQYVTGQWNAMNTTNDGSKNVLLNSGATALYKVYRTDELVPSTLKLRIN